MQAIQGCFKSLQHSEWRNDALFNCWWVIFSVLNSFTGTLQQLEPERNSRPGSSTNIAVASWGEGVIGTSSHALQKKGVVASRGVEQEVKSSKDLYHSLKPGTSNLSKNLTAKKDHNTDFARVSLNPSQPSTDDAAVTIQRFLFFD